MYTGFKVRNFRGLKTLAVRELRRVNLITGKNDVGKTALLEAIFLHSARHNPTKAMEIEAIRGHGKFPLDALSIWGWLFWERRIGESIELVGVGDNGQENVVRISLQGAGGRPLPVDLGQSDLAASGGAAVLSELRIEYTNTEGAPMVARCYIDKQELKFDAPEGLTSAETYYMSPRARIDRESAKWYTAIDAVGRIEQVVSMIKSVDDRVTRLSLGQEAEEPVLKCDIGMKELVPVYVAGEGLNRFLHIMLAILGMRDGILLVDEIDNGLHHSVLKDIWTAIAGATAKQDVQVIATTHSLECLKGAFEAFREMGELDALGVFRLDRVQSGITITRYDDEGIQTAVEMGLELRG